MFKYTFIIVLFLTAVISAQTDSAKVDSLSANVDSLPVQLKLKVGDKSDGSKMQPVHLLKLYDENGNTIEPDDDFPQPFSTKQTCATECHNYKIISDGFHFNYNQSDIANNRPSEPWIYTDPTTLSMIPISYRKNSGTFAPAEIKMSNMKFLDRFGPYYPGGDISETDSLQYPENYLRWNVSGKLEVNCLMCHDADPFYDKAEYASNIRKQNYKWAAAASSSLTEFKGNASKMPDNFDPYNFTTVQSIDQRSSTPPNIKYDKTKFNSNYKVFFNITKNVPNERCYYCHSSIVTDKNFTEHWKADEDVHIKAGLNCVDCHRNGIDHNITRGKKEADKVSTFTCKGCHTKQSEDGEPVNGTMGAPIPEHAGIPPVHFERLACTTCHSGSWPNDQARFVKSSRNHFLGMHGTNKAPNVFPHIQTGVFTESEEFVIEPRNLVWPSFWGSVSNGDVAPLPIEFIEDTIRPLLSLDSLFNFGEWPVISDSVLIAMLDTLQSFGSIQGEPVFVSNGKMFRIEGGKLKTSETKRGKAYSWSTAHTVRPAKKALGANGCQDCHSVNSPFFSGKIAVISSLESQTGRTMTMSNFENRSQFYQSVFSLTFFFRSWLKVLIILSALVIFIVVVGYAFRGFKSISKINIANESHRGDK